jgi:hypothetical protein
MKLVYLIGFFLLSFSTFSQSGKKKAFYFFDANTKLPVENVMAKDASGNDTVTYLSNIRGQIVIPKTIQTLHANHLSYRDTIIAAETNKVLLTPSTTIMEAVIIQNKKEENGGSLLRAIAGPFADVTSNMSHGSKAALFFPTDKENSGKHIKELKYEVVDVFGVKNLKYLPFRAAVYSVDTVTGLPDKPIYQSDIIKKQNNKKWVIVDVSEQNITIPPQGIFIVFEVLEFKYYEKNHQRTIWSKVGRIDAAPAVRAEMYNPNNPRKCYRFGTCTVDQDCGDGKIWQPAYGHYAMDVEFME